MSENGKLVEDVTELLRLATDAPIRIATGHCSKEEVLLVCEEAEKIGVKQLLLTHPMHPCVGFTEGELRCLSENAMIWFEQTALSLELGHQTVTEFKNILTRLPRVVFTSDFGQVVRPGIHAWYLKYKNLFDSWEISASLSEDLFYNRPKTFLEAK